MLLAVQVHENLAVEDVHRLVGGGVGVQRRHLALFERVLEQGERTACLVRGGFPEVYASAGEPAPLACVGVFNDREGGASRGHGVRLLSVPSWDSSTMIALGY